jgi:PAS domain S-box-containing protein
MIAEDLSQRVSELSQRLEELRAKCAGNPANASEILSDALENLQASLEELSAADEEIMQQNEELIEAQEALIESERHYRIAIDFTHDWEYWLGPDRKHVYISPSCERITGYRPEEFMKRPRLDLDIVHPDDRATYEQHLKDHFDAHFSSAHIDYRITTANGEIKWISHLCQPVFGENGEWLGRRASNRDITERKQVEEELRKSKALLSSIFRSAPIGMGVAANRIFIEVNEQMCEITGYSREELLGKNSRFLYPSEEDYEYVGRTLYGIIEKGGIGEAETRFRCRDGRVIDIFLRCSSLLPGNASAGISYTVLDITERKKAEESLKEVRSNLERSLRFTEALLSAIPTPAFFKDREGRYIGCNRAFSELIGVTADQIKGKTVEEFWSAEYAAVYRQKDLELIEHPGVQVYDFKVQDKDGVVHPVIYVKNVFYDEHNEIAGIVGTFVDITERKCMEEALRKSKDELEQRVQERTAELEEANKALYSSEQRLLLAQKAGGVGVYDWNPGTGEIIYTSELKRIYGIPSTSDPKQQQKAWLNCVHPEDLKHALGRIQRLLDSTQNELEEEYRIIRPDGKERWIASRSLVIRDFDNRPLRVIGTNIDITERKQAEKELMKAKEAAEEAVKIKSAFMANMSHELRTPMNAVLGFTSILLDEDLTEEHKDYLERIRNGGQALLVLINEVMNFSRMKMGIVDLELQSFDLRNITEEALDMVAAEAANKGLELIYAFDKNVPEAIIGDPGKLRQILSNLLSNAVKFTKEGDVEVFVSFDPDEDKVHFAVRDTGIGISHEDIGKLFQPFSQLDMSYSSGYEGMGMGLAICKKLVDLMDGRIWVESEAGIGSTFQFTVPAETAPCENKPFLAGNFRNKRVLIVEGNQILRRILGRQVYAWGILPVIASSIQEAVDLLQRDSDFHAVIIDTGKDDAVSIIAERRNRWKQLPSIALIAPGQRVPPNLFQAVLVKPLKPAKLFQTFQDVLEKRDVSEPIEMPEAEKSYGLLSILLAEDDLSNQEVTLEMLKKLGYRADAVVNGQEVLEALERQPYDIIFMDVKMPVMSGTEAARKIRERWPENGPKIIAVTAYAMHGDKEKCLAAGMDGYIPKPVRKEDLAKVLENMGKC